MRSVVSKPAELSALTTSACEAPFLMSTVFPRGSRCIRLHFFRLDCPSTRTKFLSSVSTMTHILPASLPAIFMQMCPIFIFVSPHPCRSLPISAGDECDLC